MDPVVLNRYLADQLSEPERVEFEKRLIESPAVVEELEAAARLKVGLFSLRRSDDLQRVLSSAVPWFRPHVVALAASLAVLAIGIVVWRGDSPSASSVLAASLTSLVDESGAQPSIVGRHAVLRTRVDGYDAIIERSPSPGVLEVRVLPDVSATRSGEEVRYRVELARVRDDATLEAVATVTGLKSDQDGFVTVFASASHLTPGRYRLTIASDGGGPAPREEDSFLIRVR